MSVFRSQLAAKHGCRWTQATTYRYGIEQQRRPTCMNVPINPGLRWRQLTDGISVTSVPEWKQHYVGYTKKNFREILHQKCTLPSSSKHSCNDSTVAFRLTTSLQRNSNRITAEVRRQRQTMTFPMRLSSPPFSR